MKEQKWPFFAKLFYTSLQAHYCGDQLAHSFYLTITGCPVAPESSNTALYNYRDNPRQTWAHYEVGAGQGAVGSELWRSKLTTSLI